MTWGVYDQIISGSESDIMSWIVTIHNVWLSVEHLYRWWADMRNGSNRLIGLQRLRILAQVERNDQIKRKWYSLSIYNIIKFHINSFDYAEEGDIQLHTRLGSDVMHHVNILTHILKSLDTNTCGDMYEWVKQLDDNLRYIGVKSRRNFIMNLLPSISKMLILPKRLQSWRHWLLHWSSFSSQE